MFYCSCPANFKHLLLHYYLDIIDFLHSLEKSYNVAVKCLSEMFLSEQATITNPLGYI